jgi:hypothetical protein
MKISEAFKVIEDGGKIEVIRWDIRVLLVVATTEECLMKAILKYRDEGVGVILMKPVERKKFSFFEIQKALLKSLPQWTYYEKNFPPVNTGLDMEGFKKELGFKE